MSKTKSAIAMTLMAKMISECKDPAKKAELISRGKAMLVAAQDQKETPAIKAARERVAYLRPVIKQLEGNGDKRRAAELRKELNNLVEKYGLILEHKRKATPKLIKHEKRDTRLVNKRAVAFAERKFSRLQEMNESTDNKDLSMEQRLAAKQGKNKFVERETEFNGDRRPAPASNNSLSWNPKTKRNASAKGVRK